MAIDFDDISYESEFDRFFTEKDAKSICRFLSSCPNNFEKIFISCEAGVSRSAGLAAALDEFFNRAESIFFYDSSLFPNMLVYRKMKNALKNTKL